ncbi:hypothetical protein DSL72_002244 [Monilinia vaccinii-corymbosi]|uniref:Uncharacterized protein n=1 Tax=Monilinia vaccinii-corymbosi TaxID=61207 RepID=A0A8A3PC26_9HELO|nr:hypothetical protein DSL72_002244 [Monilinia vaccinii-corymbosi]
MTYDRLHISTGDILVESFSLCLHFEIRQSFIEDHKMDAQNTIEVDDTSIFHPSTSITINPPVPSTSCVIWSPFNSRCSLHQVIYPELHSRQFSTWRTFRSNGIPCLDTSKEDPLSLRDDNGDVVNTYAIDHRGNRLLGGLDPRAAVIDAYFRKIKCLDIFIKVPLFLHDDTNYVGNAYMDRRYNIASGDLGPRGAVIDGLFRKVKRDALKSLMIAFNMKPIGRDRTYETLGEDTETGRGNATPSGELRRISLFDSEVRLFFPGQSSRFYFPPFIDIQAGFEDRILALNAGQEQQPLSEHETDGFASENSRAGERDRLAKGNFVSPIQQSFIYHLPPSTATTADVGYVMPELVVEEDELAFHEADDDSTSLGDTDRLAKEKSTSPTQPSCTFFPPSTAMTAGVGYALPELVVEENELAFYEAEDDSTSWGDIDRSHQCVMKQAERARSILNSLHDDSVGGEDRGIFEQDYSGHWNGIEPVLEEGNIGVSNGFQVDWDSEEEEDSDDDDVEEKSYRMNSGAPRVSRLTTIWECEEEEEEEGDDVEEKIYRMNSGVPRVSRLTTIWECEEEEEEDDVEEECYRMNSGVPRVSRLKTIWESEDEE